MTGELYDGTPIEGSDCIVLRGIKATHPGDHISKATLLGNYPNPFNPTTEISLELSAAATVKLEVYNILGEKVATLFSGRLEAGRHAFEWDAGYVGSGVYFYRLEADGFVQTKKMLLIR